MVLLSVLSVYSVKYIKLNALKPSMANKADFDFPG